MKLKTSLFVLSALAGWTGATLLATEGTNEITTPRSVPSPPSSITPMPGATNPPWGLTPELPSANKPNLKPAPLPPQMPRPEPTPVPPQKPELRPPNTNLPPATLN